MNSPIRLHGGSANEERQKIVGRQRALIKASREAGIKKALRQFNQSLRKADADQMVAAVGRLRILCTLSEEVNTLLSAYLLESVSSEGTEEHRSSPTQCTAELSVYCVGSLLLHKCYQSLMQKKPGLNEEPEWMLAVTGLRIGPFLTLEHALEVELCMQSSMHAAADMRGFTQLTLELDRFGQALHAIFHSHRFNGPPTPSPVDLNLQETLEQASYPAIQAAFSSDGYVRFFALSRPFEILVYGRGVQRHGRFLYRLNQMGEIPYP